MAFLVELGSGFLMKRWIKLFICALPAAILVMYSVELFRALVVAFLAMIWWEIPVRKDD